MNKVTYCCNDCHAEFEVYKVNANSKVKCQFCGSMKTRASMIGNTHKVVKKGNDIFLEPIRPEEFSAKYACINCAGKFEWSITKRGTPQCPKCSSVECVAISPIASAHVEIKEKPKFTKTQIKRIQFIRKNYAQLKKAEDHFRVVKTELERLGVKSEYIAKYDSLIEEIIQHINKLHEKRLKDYGKR